MPRPGPARSTITIRISPEGIDALDTRAEEEGVTRSELLRLFVTFGLTKYPRRGK